MARNENYDEFVEKFKPKLTTDDCYTPNEVYEAIKEWAVNEYNLQGKEIVRPFFPDGDFENFVYGENCVVIDNPPFSILKKIKSFYVKNNIPFFLFAPHLTLFSSNDGGVNYVVTGSKITYANGARVSTSFATNLGECFIRTAPDLRRKIKIANEKSNPAEQRTKYVYPKNIISGALLGKCVDKHFELKREQCVFVRKLDSQKEIGKNLYGAGFIISDEKAAEIYEREREQKQDEDAIVLELSEREKQIVKNLQQYN